MLIGVGDRQLAEDLVADAFTKAWMSWPRVREHPSPRGWVVRTALNTHVSWWRRRRREVALGRKRRTRHRRTAWAGAGALAAGAALTVAAVVPGTGTHAGHSTVLSSSPPGP